MEYCDNEFEKSLFFEHFVVLRGGRGGKEFHFGSRISIFFMKKMETCMLRGGRGGVIRFIVEVESVFFRNIFLEILESIICAESKKSRNYMFFSSISWHFEASLRRMLKVKNVKKMRKNVKFDLQEYSNSWNLQMFKKPHFESMFWTFFSLSLKKFYTSRMSKKSQFRFSTVFRFIKMFIKKRLSLVRIEHKNVILLDINNDFLWSE